MMPPPTMARSVRISVMPGESRRLPPPSATRYRSVVSDPLFKHLDADGLRPVTVTVDGRSLHLPEGMALAAALLAAGVSTFHRSVRAGEPRGPLCLMGSCFQCVAVVDGVANTRTCRLPVRAGMVIELRVPPVPEDAA